MRAQSVLTAAGRRRPITASIGIALFGDTERLSAEDVLVNADLAMYDAKEAGRDRAATYSSQERGASRMKARITWAERIREALEEDRFTLYAQPIVELRERRGAPARAAAADARRARRGDPAGRVPRRSPSAST